MALHLNKLLSALPKNDLCQIWLKFACWFLRRGFLNVVNIFLLFRNYLPYIWTNLNFLVPRMHYAKIPWNQLSCSCEDKNVKSLHTDGQTTTDNKRSEKLTWAFSSDEEIKGNKDLNGKLEKIWTEQLRINHIGYGFKYTEKIKQV